MSSELEFFDGESGRIPFSDQASFKSIVMNTVMRLGYYYAVEFRGGIWVNTGQGVSMYLQNTREVVVNEVEYLWMLLEPHMDDDTKKERAEYYDRARKNKDESDDEESRSEKIKELRLNLAHKTFRLLSRWLKENNYLEGTPGTDRI